MEKHITSNWKYWPMVGNFILKLCSSFYVLRVHFLKLHILLVGRSTWNTRNTQPYLLTDSPWHKFYNFPLVFTHNSDFLFALTISIAGSGLHGDNCLGKFYLKSSNEWFDVILMKCSSPADSRYITICFLQRSWVISEYSCRTVDNGP